jgi:acyl-CoA reductase-like NAD-dependent aldehyde dehydrogenase
VIVGVDNRSAIAQQEVFGPVLIVIPFDDDDEAVRIANDSAYGLAGAVMSRSMDRGMNIARRIRTGSFGVNGGMFYGADAPFGVTRTAESAGSAASRASSSTWKPRPSDAGCPDRKRANRKAGQQDRGRVGCGGPCRFPTSKD